MGDTMEEEVTDDEYRAALEALQSTISGKTLSLIHISEPTRPY